MNELGKREDQRWSTKHSKDRDQREEEKTAKKLKREQPGKEEEILKAVASWKSSKEWSYYASAADRANVRAENWLLDLAT